MGKCKISKQFLMIASCVYIYVPILIFLFGWTKWYIAVVCTIALGYGVFQMIKEFLAQKDEREYIEVDIGIFLVVMAFFLMIGYYAGWGRFVEQSGDWEKHNGVMWDLVARHWPVYYVNGSENSFLSYYIAHYLVPAIVGKVFDSFRAAELAFYVWSEIGLTLVYLNLIRVFKVRKRIMQLISALLMCMYSAPLLLSQVIQRLAYPWDVGFMDRTHWYVVIGNIQLQYSGNYSMLRWVAPQVIVLWMTMLMFYEHKEKIQHYITLMLPALLFGTLTFVGMLPFAFVMAVVVVVQNKDVKHWLKNVFSVSNIATLATLGAVLFLYFYGNVFGPKPDEIGVSFVDYSGGNLNRYFIFVGGMVLLPALTLLIKNYKNPLYYTAVVLLTVLPLVRMGFFNDLVMRCSIPSLFVMFILVVDFANHVAETGYDNLTKKFRASSLALIMMVSIGLMFQVQELMWCVYFEDVTVLAEELGDYSLEKFANRESIFVANDLKYNYYAYDIDKNLFYKYIARQ